MQKTLGALRSVALACGAFACGEGQRAEVPSFSTTVRSDAVLGALTIGDQAQLCEQLDAFGSRLRSSTHGRACKLAGVLQADVEAGEDGEAADAVLQGACASAYDACVSASDDAAGARSSCDFSQVNATNCTATVADFAACVEDAEVQLNGLYSALPDCHTVTRASLASALTFDCGQIPAGCATLVAKCPGLWGLANGPTTRIE
jgi:hypothetical protein